MTRKNFSAESKGTNARSQASLIEVEAAAWDEDVLINIGNSHIFLTPQAAHEFSEFVRQAAEAASR